MSAFFIYKQDVFDQVKRENPEAKIIDLTKIISLKWQSLDQEAKNMYEQRNIEAKKKYDEDLKAYEEKNGKGKLKPFSGILNKEPAKTSLFGNLTKSDGMMSEEEETKPRSSLFNSSVFDRLGKVICFSNMSS